MKVWFNRGLSNTYDALTIIRAADHAGAFGLLASHSDETNAVGKAADTFFVEPAGLEDDAYGAWCLEQCRARGVDLFVPQRRRQVIGRQRAAFEAAGVRLSIMAEPAVMDLVDQKHAFYDDLIGSGVAVPPYRLFRGLEEFDLACAELGGEAAQLCVKPSVGVYAAGFRILEREGCELKRILSGDGFRTSFAAFREALAGSSQDRDMMVMTYLPGVERSVDVLACRGTLVRAVSRVKVGSHQVLETTGPSIDMAALLTRRYGLDGVFNLQTREGDGIPYLLEINSRMSGGLIYSCQSGVALPYWNILLTLGMAGPQDVPPAKAGLRVAPIQGCLQV
ncbi:ATP-grasp domain-containing protein [Rhodospirillum rubrum]|uniref:ATP-grasp domain-containing protein n=1 Tax=Rhodospirillum rubrum (strain ATCC 11170 / ATH 1.1.1 / DSM 467 / LMG 4362 / NCIMB 8255 / S1) TaxID=269796 RepID=Q2RVZ8_RHORT|nr:ATP-grasp domain-containing protein [Rhodospirillum rubrum]ABC21697.1 conserved hypothetical protein [Rhodospirillum rubrum ATCC 11170]AEO47395.1 hypothetical protein F11_04625 [Rhodospirillum rubrum F11]MBK5953250.1 hypothetical protein [Rhodospirillum rubrum]QXG81359.1 ATP-grasp domain-containing protein [Rhodospirillum rubrum]HAP99558.1 hypothetical protein [Rhodospirillum rubrum]